MESTARIFLLVLVTALINGCSLFVTEDSFGKSWTGEPMQTLIDQWGEPAEKKILEDGTTEVIYEIFHGKCIYNFVAGPDGIINSYSYKSVWGGTCKPIG